MKLVNVRVCQSVTSGMELLSLLFSPLSHHQHYHVLTALKVVLAGDVKGYD